MAANKMQFQYEVTANTSQARKALADLDKALDRLNKQQKMDMGLSQELTEAADAARLLQRELNAAMDVKTGKLNVSELARGLAQAGTSVEQLSTKFLNAGTMGEAAFRGLAQSIVAAEVPMKRMNKTLSDAMTTLKNTVKWEISSTLVHGLEGAFSGAVSYAKNLNTSLTNIRIVTNQSIDDMVKFTKQANAAAKELSTTTKAYADASLIYYQQGDSQELAAKKAAITIKASNASFETSAKEMSEYLTSVWNSYQVGADELERYVDIMANLGAKTATSLEEIATSMQKVAATANTVGVSMEQVSSIIATVSSVTRESAESIGTSYKTIFARIGDLKLGKVDEDGVGLGQVSSQLDAIGVKILDETGNLREMGDIIMDLGTKWQTMNQAQKTAVAQVVAGKRQYTQLMALFENWDMFQSNMNIAENSEGALQDMADIYAESWEAASARVQASMEGIFNKIINDQSIIKITNTIADLFGGIENVIDGLGGLGGVLTSVGSIATAVFKDKMIVGINNITRSVTDFKKSFDGKKGKDIFTSFFGESSALRDYKKNLTELKNELNERAGWAGQTQTDIFVNESTQKIIEAKEKLLDIESKLTTAEKERYQASINGANLALNDIKEQQDAYKIQIQSINKLIQAQTTLEAQQEALRRIDPNKQVASANVKKEMQTKVTALSKQQMADFNLNNILPKLTAKDTSLEQLLQRFKELRMIMKSCEEASVGLQDIGTNLTKNAPEKSAERLVNILKNFKTILQSLGAKTDSIDKILNSFNSGETDIKKVEQALKQAANAMSQYEVASKKADGAQTTLSAGLGVAEGALTEVTEQAKQAATMWRRLQSTMQNTAKTIDGVLKNDGGPGSIGEKFATLAQGLASATSAFSTWSNVTANWDGMSLTETLSTIAELALDVAFSGSLAGAAMTVAGAAIGAALGYMEKKQKDSLEKVQEINDQVSETVDDIEQSNKLANETLKTFEEAEKARKEGNIGVEEYLTIVDTVLGAIESEQLKVLALKGDYEGLTEAIRQANEERLAGNKSQARNNRILAMEGLEESLKSYDGKGVGNKYAPGRNSLNIGNTTGLQIALDGEGEYDDFIDLIQGMGFEIAYNGSMGTQMSIKWVGTEADIPRALNDWQIFQERDYLENIPEQFAILDEFWKQFNTYEKAYTAEKSFEIEEALQGYAFNENKLKEQIEQGENLYQYIFDTVLADLNIDPESITQYDTDIVNKQIQDWIKYQADEIQLAFIEGWQAYEAGEEFETRATQFADKQFVQVWSSNKNKRASGQYYVQSDYNENVYEERINAQQENTIKDYGNAISAYRTATSGTANISGLVTSLLSSTFIDIESLVSEQFGEIPDNTNIIDLVSSASSEMQFLLLEKIIEALSEAILGDTGLQTSVLSLEEPVQTIINSKMAEIDQMFANETGLQKTDTFQISDYLYNNPEFIEAIKTNYDKEKKTFDQNWVASLDDNEKNIINALSENETFLTEQILSSNSWLMVLLSDLKLLYQDIATISTVVPIAERTDLDYGYLSKLTPDYKEWNDSQQQIWNKYATLYTEENDPMRNTALWGRLSEKEITAGIASVTQSAFVEKYSQNPSDTVKQSTEYLADLDKLDKYVQAATDTSLSEIDNRYKILDSLFTSISSMDLSKPLSEMLIPAEKFQKLMGMSLKDFNALPTASQKQLAIMQAQSKQTQLQAEEIRAAAESWYNTTGKTLIERGDSEAILLWAELSSQVAQAQADAANSAQVVNEAYRTLNDEVVAGIATKWERANQEAEKQQKIASILASSVSSGIISHEEAAIVDIPVEEWASYSAEVRAAKAANAAFAASNAVIESLETEQKAVAGAIEYYDEYKNAWKDHIKDADGFERALYNSYSMGDFGDGDEAIAKMNAFREARNKAIQTLGQGASADAILTEMSVILNIDKDDLESQIKQVAGSNKDTIAAIFANMSQEIKNKAQEAVDAWLSAFDTIAEARKTLLAGGSLIDQLAGDPKKIQEVFANFDGTWEEFMSGILDGSLDIDKLVTPKLTESYLQDQYTAAGITTLTGSNEERLAETRKMLEAQAKPGETVSEDAVVAKVAQDYETAIRGLVEQGLISMSDDQIKADAMALAKGEHGMGEALLAAINAYLAEAQSRVDFSEQLRVEKSKRAEDAIAISEAAKIDQTEYDKQTRLQEALEAAQAVKEKNGDWEDIDSKDRQILEANGITGLNQVDSAAMQCASALASLAEAAYNAAKTEAEAKGYSQNEAGEWGIQHTATMTEEEGRSLYGSDWDQYKTGLTQMDDGSYQYDTNFEVIKEINDPLQEANERVEELKGSMEDLPKDLWESEMKSFGLDPDEVDKLGDSIQELAKTSDQLGNSLITDAEAADELAKKMSRYNKAVEAVTNNHKKWDKAMKTGGVEEQAEAMEEMREAMSDMLDADYDELSDAFIKNAENLELMKEAAEGNNDAFDELQARAARDMVIDAQVQASFDEDSFNAAAMELASAYDNLPIGEPIVLGENTTVGDSFWSACNSILSGFAATAAGAQQAQAAFAKLGYDAEVVVEDQPVEGYTASYPMYKQGPPLQIGMGQTFYSVIGGTETIDVPGYTQKVLAIKSITPNGAGFGGNIKKGSGGSGGGGSKAKKKEKKQHKRYQDEIQRYHKNTEVLTRLSEELDKIDKLKERAYGNKHIDQLNAETDALKEQLEAQQALHDEAKKYQASDQIAVARYGAQFDADGTIVNYEEVMRNIVDEYNRAVDVYNNSAQEDGDKERLEAAEQRFEDAKKSIEDYEEAIAKANESMNDMLETQNQISEIETEKITYKLELQIDMNERDLEKFEYYQKKYEDSLKDQGIVYKSIYDSMLEYENNLVVIGEAMAALDQKRRDGLITDADYAETLQDLYDQIFENLGDLNEIQNELVDTYTNTLELAREEVEKTTDTIESANSALQSYLDIIALSGGETDYEKMAYFYEKMNENNLIKINIQRDHLNALLEEEDKFQEKIKSGQQLTDLEKKQYEALREEIQDTRDTLLSSTTEALEAIRTAYENTINGIAKDFEEFMVGAGDSIDHLQEQYGYFQEEQENYVSTAKELYEVSKLNRDIEGALGDATSKAAKEALKALQEKINKQSELNQLTEYDIEMNQLQYELLMARIKLEESQNAKDVVRLTRDENGNYAYRYTANQDKIDEAVQNYEDKLQEINDLTAQRTSEIEGRMLETMAWAKEQMSAIAMDYTLTEEEKRDRLAELNSQFAAKMQYLHEQNGIATENLITNQEAIAEHYGVNLSEITSSTAGNVNTQIQSMIEKTQEYITKMNEALFGEGGADQSWKDYLEDIGIITSNAGTAYGDMVENTQEMGEMNHWSAEQAQEVIETLTDTLEPLETLTAAWNAHNSILEATISDYENLAQVIQGVLSAVGEIPNGGSATDVDGHAYAKGGMVDYTGLAWVDGSPSDPEMMLNPGDTQNILKATAMVKSLDSGFIGALVDSVKSAAQAMMHMFSGAAHAVTNIHPAATEALEQSVHITAEFPNVQDHNEIEEALLGLVNRSAQFANQKK